MIDEPRARELGAEALETHDDVFVLGDARELEQGWFFPCIAKRIQGITGVIVNKQTGRVFRVLIRGALNDDPTLYDRGYQFEQYDLVVLAVANLEEAVRAIEAMHYTTRDTYYRYERVWRVGRALTAAEIRERLGNLPAIFSGRLAFDVEHLENARKAGWFEFKVLEYRGRD
jgi:hypothetical protein